ncbi:hypothetical protein BOV91_06370, partial [Solemya velum gill symbiont]
MEVINLSEAAHPDHAIKWVDSEMLLLDQRVMPHVERFVRCTDAQQTAEAITAMVVRGAPAIGITAAYGVVLSVMHRLAEGKSN